MTTQDDDATGDVTTTETAKPQAEPAKRKTATAKTKAKAKAAPKPKATKVARAKTLEDTGDDASATKDSAKPAKAAKDAKAAKAAKAPRKAAAPSALTVDQRTHLQHGATSVRFLESDRDLVMGLVPLAEEIQAAGDLVVHMVAADAGAGVFVTTLVDRPLPGLILRIDPAAGVFSLDGEILGALDPATLHRAACAMLSAVVDGDGDERTTLGWHADWQARAVEAAAAAA